MGEDIEENAATTPSLRERTSQLVQFEDLNLVYFDDSKRGTPQSSQIEERITNFEEVHAGYDNDSLLNEAKRCFSCGSCPACDNCMIFCPDAAIASVKDNPAKFYHVDTDYCKGCGICAVECPRGCIIMVPVR